MSKDQYYELDGYINYTLIKRVSISANLAFLEKEEEKPKTKLQRVFDLGHIIERYVLEDKDISYIRLDKTPELTGHSLVLFNSLLTYCQEENINSVKELKKEVVESLITELSLWKNIRSKELLSERYEDVLTKLNFYLTLNEDDVVANEDVSSLLVRLDEGIKNFDVIRKIVYPSDPKIEVINQLPIILEEGLPLPAKGLLDRVHIDHKKKEIVILDVKSMDGRVENFLTSFFTHKYYYQLPFYYRLFRLAYPEFASYTISLKFLALSKTSPDVPALYTMHNDWIDRAWNGWTNKLGYTIKGINQLIDEIKWYKEIGGPALSYELAMNNSELIIKADWNE